jgi:cell division protein FtsQ
MRWWRRDRVALPASVLRFAARGRHWRSAWVLVPLAAVVVLVGAGGYVLWETHVFAVRQVTVVGTKTLGAQRVLAVARVPRGVAMARLDTGAVQTRVLDALPAVDTVEVHRSWPSTVRLVVRERQVVAVVNERGAYELIDREGVPFRTVRRPPAGMIVLDLRRAGPGDDATRAALDVLAALPRDLRGQVQRIAAPTAAQVTLVLTKDRTVSWGTSDASARKALVLHTLLHRSGHRYDVSSPDLVTVS